MWNMFLNFPGDPANVNPQKDFSKTETMGLIFLRGLRINIFLSWFPGEILGCMQLFLIIKMVIFY